MVGGIAVITAAFSFFQARKQRLRDAEQWYVERYWAIQDQIEVTESMDGPVLKKPSNKNIYDELRLCEDELDLRRNGFLTNPAWQLWSESIRAIADDSAKMSVLERVPKSELELLRAYLVDRGYKDPIGIGRWRKFWRGIY
ncbi:hypothetical protein ACFDTO_28945 [Microbacteriaceae bacterium 4G12]